METRGTKLDGWQSTVSRRTFLKGAAALAAAASAPKAFGQPPTGAPAGTVWLYISTYTGDARTPPKERDGDLLMRAQSFHGGVNRRKARRSGLAGDGTVPIYSESLDDCSRSGAGRTCMPEMNTGRPEP